MGKATKARSSPAKPVALTPEVLTKVSDLRTEAGKQFLAKEFSKAADNYDAAFKLLPDGSAEKPELLQKKVGCLINLKKYKEAARDATTVLEMSPNSTSALKSRAKANEQLGFLTKALSDAQAINRTDAATNETREMEKRLKDAVSGRSRPASAPAPSANSKSSSAMPQNPYHLTVKATLAGESKFIYTNPTIGYLELLDEIRAKFHGSGPVALKFVDKDGDTVTISSRSDIQVCINELVVQFQKQMQGMQGKMMSTQLPPLKLIVEKVASEALVPKAPAAEVAERGGKVDANGVGGQPMYEAEDWIMDFVRLFTDVTGLDPAAHIENHQLGNDKLQRAMTETTQSDEADGLFDQAAEHFRDAMVSSYIQWGNVYIYKADKLLHKLQKTTAPGSAAWAASPELAQALALYDLTEAKVRDALKVHPDSYEAVGSLAQLEFERAKAKMGYVLPHPAAEEGESSPKTQEEVQAALNKQLVAVLSTIGKDKVLQVQPLIEKLNTTFEEAHTLAKKAHTVKVARDAEREAKAGAEAPAAAAPEAKAESGAEEPLPFSSAPSNMLVMHGNILYDWSQVLAATDALPWRPVLDKAAALFRASGAPEQDVRGALKNHTRKDELDLGPDPEPQAPVTPAAKEAPTPTPAPAAAAAASAEKKATPEAKKEAKGLPTLEVKKKAAK